MKVVAIQSPATRAFLRCCAPDRGVASPEYFFKGLMQDTIQNISINVSYTYVTSNYLDDVESTEPALDILMC